MSNFKLFSQLVHEQFNLLASNNLFVTNLTNDQLWNTYLDSFPPGTNDIYLTNTHHDCSCCRNFVKEIGGVVAIIDNKQVSVWDIDTTSLAPEYQAVTAAMSELVATSTITGPYIRNTNHGRKVSQITTPQQLDDGTVINWNHFHCVVPEQHSSKDKAEVVGRKAAQASTFKRSLEELSMDACTTVLDLINANNLYRGTEHKTVLAKFISHKQAYDIALNKDFFIWQHYTESNNFRSSVIGTLIQDLSDGKGLEESVASFESKVAPTNYKRTSALITPRMVEKAVATIKDLGYEDSLQRRHATLEDISVNNVLFVDNSAAPVMKDSLTDLLMTSAVKPTLKNKKTKDISINDFVKKVLPKAVSMRLQFENAYVPKLVNIIAPETPDSKNLTKWNNNFTWTYNGGVTDSMKELVKGLGGKVDGVLRFSIQWNENKLDSNNDLDAHAICPAGHIYFLSKRDNTGGNLDVDITCPANKTAVENITWPTLSRMKDGSYKFNVHNYSGTNTDGFRAEIEFNGEVISFDYPRSVLNKQTVEVATVTLKNNVFTLKSHLDSTTAQKEVWGITTNSLVDVDTIMYSPNFWDNQQVGNQHTIFTLKGCNNPEPTRGLFNEYLTQDLYNERKVMETLGSKLQVPVSPKQLAGVGFSSTLKDSVVVEVTTASDKRLYTIQF